MYNSNVPSRAELPSSQQLLRSTVIAAIVAIVLLVTVVFPAEYGKDWTGIGRVLGLTEMGEIKADLAREAAADAAAAARQREDEHTRQHASGQAHGHEESAPSAPVPRAEGATPPATAPLATTPAMGTAAPSGWRDELTASLKPGEGIEIKLVMKEGEKASFAWTVEGGVVNYDTHGDGPGRSISYVKGRGVPADEGELVAAFTGNHGWFWRNRGKEDVKLVLRTGGQYSAIKRP
ncbi:MAG: transmembrane anchor protein [Hydrogenophaga sp.]|uniref:transmembrane anchor protein n=1 Tax=Hydrogenophaga sp. TaxID=1904254 RepID=UPI0016AF2C90|nr:transmembrane anchor protein [Hydrogenophaga sp.]NIM42351.1 transmembrane anchor protein [Hydrogenophaga sp.]NIN27506.1 transmembrane anchor protein [Hydrogenophaga sp.]NIN32325.1 transmembrane anchor protein [Hydrogenophaga sp.]NIN56559.1 transmembrane anchor protein [Hydrogenophaga sp.]NIO52922.1 transmembrane anchor protein [Hydrogenophaga sp.]